MVEGDDSAAATPAAANARADFEDLDEPDRAADRNLRDDAALALRRQQAYTALITGRPSPGR